MTKRKVLAGIAIILIAAIGLGFVLSKMTLFIGFQAMFFTLIALGLAMLVGIVDLVKKTFHSKFIWVTFFALVLALISSGVFQSIERKAMQQKADLIVNHIDHYKIENGTLPDSLNQLVLEGDLLKFCDSDVSYWVKDSVEQEYYLSYDVRDGWHEKVYDASRDLWYLDD
jgi:hypothetical protein